jgi:hypothetical protein
VIVGVCQLQRRGDAVDTGLKADADVTVWRIVKVAARKALGCMPEAVHITSFDVQVAVAGGVRSCYHGACKHQA